VAVRRCDTVEEVLREADVSLGGCACGGRCVCVRVYMCVGVCVCV
jgi:hypothetical protein